MPKQLDWDLPSVGDVAEAPGLLARMPAANAAVVRDLGRWLRKERVADLDDAELIKFAHSCDYDVGRAQACIRAYYATRMQALEIFSEWDTSLPNIKSILEVILVAIVPRRTPDNCRVVINSLQTPDTSGYVFADVCKIMTMTMEAIFLADPTSDGLIVIHDMGKASLSHFFKFGWRLPKKLNAYTQDGLPLKQRTMHLVNCSGFIDRGLKMMSHIGRKEDWERLRVHRGDDYSELHKYIPPDCLPCEFGGTLPPLKKLHDMTVRRLGEFADIFHKQLP